VTTCAVPQCAIPVNTEVGPPFCDPHWSMLDPVIKGRIHSVVTREAGIWAALTVIGRAEEWIARHPTRHCRRPPVAQG
jgi:hypothetical protein